MLESTTNMTVNISRNVLVEIAEKLKGIAWDDFTRAEHNIINILILNGIVQLMINDNGQPAITIIR